MNITTAALQDLINAVGHVFQKRAKELDITAQEDFAESDLVKAQEATTAEIDKLKRLFAQTLDQANVQIMQEDGALREEGEYVVMPKSIGCTC